jgi:hypothetical protein
MKTAKKPKKRGSPEKQPIKSGFISEVGKSNYNE